jgi:hypothetical protein
VPWFDLKTLDHFWAGKVRLDAAKVDIEGYETKLSQGGRKTIASHRRHDSGEMCIR